MSCLYLNAHNLYPFNKLGISILIQRSAHVSELHPTLATFPTGTTLCLDHLDPWWYCWDVELS